jgi:hypothetical protein
MASIVEDYLESPGMEQETDDVFPCKGCGEVWCSALPAGNLGMGC